MGSETRICPMKTLTLYKEDFISDCWRQICDEINAPLNAIKLEIVVAGIQYDIDTYDDYEPDLLISDVVEDFY